MIKEIKGKWCGTVGGLEHHRLNICTDTEECSTHNKGVILLPLSLSN